MLNQVITICLGHLSPCNLTHWGQNGLGRRKKSSVVHISWSFISKNKTKKKSMSGHNAAMNYVFPKRHPSPLDFCCNGGPQSSSKEALSIFCRAGKNPPEHRLGLASSCSRDRDTGTFPHHCCLASGHGRGSKPRGSTGGGDLTCPSAELNLRYPPQLLISPTATQHQGWGTNRFAWNQDSWWVQDMSEKCRKGIQTGYYWMLVIWLRCFCSSSVGTVNEKVVKGSEFPEYLTVSAFLDPCRSGYRRSTAQRLHCTGSPGYRWISGLQDVIVRSISCLWCPEVLLSCFWSSARIDGTVFCSLFPWLSERSQKVILDNCPNLLTFRECYLMFHQRCTKIRGVD